MNAWVRNPLLNAGALVFPPSQEPARHVPTFRDADGIVLGYAQAFCLRCRTVISSEQWAVETCPGLPVETP